MRNDVFVKINCKTIGELKSTIIDKGSTFAKSNDKYIMCAGKYTKEGWSIVFKANSIEEAEEILASNKFSNKNPQISQQLINNIIIEEQVSLHNS